MLVLDNIMEQFSTLAVSMHKIFITNLNLLNDEEANFVPLPNFEQLDNIRVILVTV